jgi:hypothetical protein
MDDNKPLAMPIFLRQIQCEQRLISTSKTKINNCKNITISQLELQAVSTMPKALKIVDVSLHKEGAHRQTGLFAFHKWY